MAHRKRIGRRAGKKEENTNEKATTTPQEKRPIPQAKKAGKKVK